MALLEVEIVRFANDAMDHYRTEYSRRYSGTEPLLPGAKFAAGITLFGDLIRKVGYERLTHLLSSYLKSDGENGWYKKMGHTLDTFGKSIEQINAMTKSGTSQNRDLKIQVRSQCTNENCKKVFLLEVMASDLGQTYNELCEGCKKQGKAPSKPKWFF